MSARRRADLEETAAQTLVRLLTQPDDDRFADDRASGPAGQIERDFQTRADRVEHRRADEEAAAGKVPQRAVVLNSIAPEGHLPAGRGPVAVAWSQPHPPPDALEKGFFVDRFHKPR